MVIGVPAPGGRKVAPRSQLPKSLALFCIHPAGSQDLRLSTALPALPSRRAEGGLRENSLSYQITATV